MAINVSKTDTIRKCWHCHKNDATVEIGILDTYDCGIVVSICDSCRFELAHKLVEAH